MASTYETDFYAWTQQTADQLRSGEPLTPEDLNLVIATAAETRVFRRLRSGTPH